MQAQGRDGRLQLASTMLKIGAKYKLQDSAGLQPTRISHRIEDVQRGYNSVESHHLLPGL